MMVTAVRAEDLPPNYDGDPYKAPYQALREECAHVYVRWRLWGHTGRTSARPHGKSAKFESGRQILLWQESFRKSDEPSVLCDKRHDPKERASPCLVFAL